jgi:hypothetical protein
VAELREKQGQQESLVKQEVEKTESEAAGKAASIKAFFETTIGASNDLND